MSVELVMSKNPLFEENGAQISLEEWSKFIEDTSSLRAQELFEQTNPVTGDVLSFKVNNAAVFTDEHSDEWTLYWSRGRVRFRYVNDRQVQQIKPIASGLNAKIYEEESGEEYTPIEPAPYQSFDDSRSESKPWWKFW